MRALLVIVTLGVTVECSQYWPPESTSCSGVEVLSSSCPAGLFCEDGHCQCGVYPRGYVTCNGTCSFLSKHISATFDDTKKITSVGYVGNEHFGSGIYIELPTNVSQLNGIMCGSTNRTGTLCGRCLPGHYPLAYSFDDTCIPCPHARWNWVRYIMAAYLPLTILYILMVIFRINTISNNLFVPVFFCQTLTMPFIVRSIMPEINHDFGTTNARLAKTIIAIYGIWNLDFGRPFYTDLCLGIGILPTLALDYAIAVYPLLLILASYLLITLHDRNYRIVTIPWRPFKLLSALFQKQWNIRTSVIDAFAAFFFLSNVKILSASFDLLIPARVYQLYPDHYNYTLGLFYAGDIEYFGKEHLPYALLAIAVMGVFVFLPLSLLALYPFRWFQSFLNLFPVRWYILHTFVDPFYGYYKNGTQPGVRDYRWCASVFYIFRFCEFLLYAVFDDKLTYNIAITMVIILYLILIAITQPFIVSRYNTINTVFLHLLSLFSLAAIGITVSIRSTLHYAHLFYSFAVIVSASPLLFTIGSFLYWVYTQKGFFIAVYRRIRAWKNGYATIHDCLPDRIENSCNYPRENLAVFPAQ